jgi:tetratricopeptide (TPR) repeat protein
MLSNEARNSCVESHCRSLAAVSFALLLPLLTTGLWAAPPLELPEYARAFHRGDYARAVALAAEHLKARPGDAQAQIVIARGEAAMGHFEAAFDGFRKALRLDPRSPDALYYLGVTAGVLAQAEQERLLAMAPGSSRAHQLLGESYALQDKKAEAEAEFKAALEVGPPSVDVLVALGDVMRSTLSFADARAYYAQAAELAPDSYDALYGLGACDSYAGEHAKAVGYFRRALRVAPGSAPAHLALGISLLQTGQAASAVTELEAAARLEPRMRQAYYQLGRAYQALGRSKEAEVAFAKVQELIRQQRGADEAFIERPDPR